MQPEVVPGSVEEPKASNQVSFDARTRVTVARPEDFDMTGSGYTIFARIKTRRGGTILSKTEAGPWVPGGKALFIRGGRLAFDIGWVNVVQTGRQVDDDKWHDVAMTYTRENHRVLLFIDGQREGQGTLVPKGAPRGPVVRIGFTAPNFPNPTYFEGEITEVRFYQRPLNQQQIAALGAKEPEGDPAVARWRFDRLSGTSIRDETGHGHEGQLERLPPAIDVLSELAPGFSTQAVGLGGLAVVSDHFGRPWAIQTHPVDRDTPCILRAEVDVPPGKRTSLVLDVSHHPRGDWQLVVRADRRILWNETIGARTTQNGWKRISVDLSRLAGRRVHLELLNQANGWAWEFAYWGRIVVVSQERD
jgi:hypothetical protein